MILNFLNKILFTIVAVVDTGIKPVSNMRYCNYGHKSFAYSSPFIDRQNHGTTIGRIISRFPKRCVISIKVSDKRTYKMPALIKALKYVLKLKPKPHCVNLSYGGLNPYPEEKALILKMLDKGYKVVAAAGNFSMNLSKQCNYYPACYDKRIIVVGSKASFSNYGAPVDYVVPAPIATSFAVPFICANIRNLEVLKKWQN
ncbi:hypothetical protein D6779_03245 [Candidatus Parcubacteria bacterium]|nr:MAG: hypothetical protein D6779_03245 [Candidatus Parcubacteria bacterium]